MKRFLPAYIIITVIIIMLSMSCFKSVYAQQMPPEQENQEQTHTEETEPEIKLEKKPVIIDGKTILYIGAKDSIASEYRVLSIKTTINNTIKEAIRNNIDPVKIDIIAKDDHYLFTIAGEEVLKATDIDAKVNEVELEKLIKTWKYNIKELIDTRLKDKAITPEKHPLIDIGIALALLIILLIIIEILKKQISNFIMLISTRIIEKFNKTVKELSKTRAIEQPEESEEAIKTAIENNELEKKIITSEYQEEPIDEKKKQKEDEEPESDRLDEKINILASETSKISNIIIGTIQIILIVAFFNYSLYILPITHPYLVDLTHFEISVYKVLKESLKSWILSKQTWQSLGIILLIILATMFINTAINVISSAIKNIIQVFLEKAPAREKRVQTLAKIIKTTVQIAVVALAVILVLSEIGIDVTPIIAGASIIGLAVSFGAQSLVKDIITGIFILIENQFGIGDIVSIGGTGGVVEDMTLRVTVLRDLSGKAHIIPNGQITQVSVLSKTWARAHLDIGIAYKEDIDTAIKIIKETADKMWHEFPEKIIAEPEVLGVNEFADSAVIIKLIMNTAPAQQWFIERQYRRRIKYAFDQNNIEIPFPHRTVYMPQYIGYDSNQQSNKFE